MSLNLGTCVSSFVSKNHRQPTLRLVLKLLTKNRGPVKKIVVHEELVYTVIFTAEEYKVLKIFIKDLGPKLASNTSCSAVFPAKKNRSLTFSTQDLSLSAAWKISCITSKQAVAKNSLRVLLEPQK